MAIVQEASRLDQNINTDLWFGSDPKNGLSIITANSFNVEVGPIAPSVLWSIIPLKIYGPRNFHLLAVWTRQEAGYVQSLHNALKVYRDFFKVEESVVMGDFNANAIWDNPRQSIDFSRLAQLLEEEFGLKSAYHTFFVEPYGLETRPTLYFQWQFMKPYHIDYCFVPSHWILDAVEVGSYDAWSSISDHCPLVVDIKKHWPLTSWEYVEVP